MLSLLIIRNGESVKTDSSDLSSAKCIVERVENHLKFDLIAKKSLCNPC